MAETGASVTEAAAHLGHAFEQGIRGNAETDLEQCAGSTTRNLPEEIPAVMTITREPHERDESMPLYGSLNDPRGPVTCPRLT